MLYESPRRFLLWKATVGHGQLLLRSTKTPAQPTRIDVLFKPVRALNLRTDLDGIRLSEADTDETAAILKSIAGDDSTATDPCKIFVVESKRWRGYIAAAVMAWHEDEGAYNDPSHFDSL